jgi:hypothetical protein
MTLYRRVTRACAKRDWSPATSHDEVLSRHRANHVLLRFLDTRTPLDYCYPVGTRMDRSRDCRSPGPHILGNFHIKAPAARRAWLWRDTGELDPIGSETTIDWMVAEGARRSGEASDLQNSHADLLCDPDDGWLPSQEDYDDLVEAHDAGWLLRAQDAVTATVKQAEANRNELIPVAIESATAHLTQGEAVVVEADPPAEAEDAAVADVSAMVFEDYSERWFIVERLRSDKSLITYEEAVALAAAAFPDIDDDDIQELFEETSILDDRFIIRPAIHYAWCAVV